MADKRKTMGLSACKRGLWSKETKENNAAMPHKPRLHALGPIVSLCVRHLWIWRILSHGCAYFLMIIFYIVTKNDNDCKRLQVDSWTLRAVLCVAVNLNHRLYIFANMWILCRCFVYKHTVLPVHRPVHHQKCQMMNCCFLFSCFNTFSICEGQDFIRSKNTWNSWSIVMFPKVINL